jgi:hypothetical protein
MPRRPAKPKIGKPMAAKKLVRNPKPAGPSRTAKIDEGAGRMICDFAPCGASASVFHRWKWWCRKHDPGSEPDSACSHSNPSIVHGEPTCSFCGGILLKVAPDD